MGVPQLKVIGLVVTLLGLIGGLAFGVHEHADPLVIGGLAAAIGTGAAAAFQWFTGGNGNGPAAVLIVAGTIFASGSYGCTPAEVKEATAEATYLGQQLKCVDQEPMLPPDAPLAQKQASDARITACRKLVRERWGIVETVRDGGTG